MTLLNRRRLLLAAVSGTLLTACAQAPVGTAAPAAAPPKLVVFIAIDGLPMRQVMGEREHFGPDGFRRFLDQGAWFSQAHYSHGFTVTAAGHAVMLTGASPWRTGMIANEWRDPATLAEVYNTGDTDYHYIGEKTAPLAGTSPRKLKAETVGDVLRRLQPESKVISISGKDRGAILPGGHLGTAYMYMSETGHFASSTYYMQSHPQWVEAFNAARPADKYFGQTWAPLLPDSAYAGSAPDDQAWQADAGNGRHLPAKITGGLGEPGSKFYAALLPTPFADELTLDFARAAIVGEQLGARGKTDILAISLSSHDYVNHAFGPESRLSQDHLLQLDRHLQAFFRDLDQRVGRGNYLLALTADHGFADTPEWAKAHGRNAGRVAPDAMAKAMEDALASRFGAGPWVKTMSATGFLFNEPLIRERGLNPDEVYGVAQAAVKQVPGVGDAFTRAELAGSDTRSPVLVAMRQSWDPERAAPLQVVVQPNWLISSRPQGSSHGTPYEYDTHVPLLTWGPAWVGQGEVSTPVAVVDFAPTLAHILGLPAPAQSEGHALPLPR
jgi:predicted AlkP superfamily pyrophosphatase or phosphodiesterase